MLFFKHRSTLCPPPFKNYLSFFSFFPTFLCFSNSGILVVASAYKKEFFATRCEDFPLNDGQWHAITICQAVGKRPFGHSQLTIYVDGTMRAQSTLKYPSFSEPIAYCQIGTELTRANLPALNQAGYMNI